MFAHRRRIKQIVDGSLFGVCVGLVSLIAACAANPGKADPGEIVHTNDKVGVSCQNAAGQFFAGWEHDETHDKREVKPPVITPPVKPKKEGEIEVPQSNGASVEVWKDMFGQRYYKIDREYYPINFNPWETEIAPRVACARYINVENTTSFGPDTNGDGYADTMTTHLLLPPGISENPDHSYNVNINTTPVPADDGGSASTLLTVSGTVSNVMFYLVKGCGLQETTVLDVSNPHPAAQEAVGHTIEFDRWLMLEVEKEADGTLVEIRPIFAARPRPTAATGFGGNPLSNVNQVGLDR